MDLFAQRETGYYAKESKAAVPVPSKIAQNLKVADEDASFRYDESARNFVAESLL